MKHISSVFSEWIVDASRWRTGDGLTWKWNSIFYSFAFSPLLLFCVFFWLLLNFTINKYFHSPYYVFLLKQTSMQTCLFILCRLDWKCGCVIGWCRCQNRCWWITNIMLWWCLNVILTRIQTWIAWVWVRCGTQQVGGRFTFGTFLWFL